MKKFTMIKIVVLAMLLLTGAGLLAKDDYFPLKKNYKWNYDVIIGEDKTVENFETRKLGKKKVIPQKVTIGDAVSFDYLLDTKKGLVLYATQSSTDPEPVILDTLVYLYKKPFKAGTTWKSNITSTLLMESVNVSLTYEIQKAKETITVQAGTFEKCLKVIGKGWVERDKGLLGTIKLEVVHTNWFAPDVGFIKSHLHTSGNHMLIKDNDIYTQMTKFSKK
ncbi:MAG: hypothetical protein U9Q91_01545 [Candidatus Marinimicrobia bacterium]|nr:hypothetical protein [Candidatus Neomarinimicrobiota bacterium]